MNHARFWTGLVFLGGLPMGLVLEVVREAAPVESLLEGHVRCNGRSMTNGVVFFYSQDGNRASDVIAVIGSDGFFSCRPVWPMDDGARVRFKVLVYSEVDACPSSAAPPGPASGFSSSSLRSPVAKLRGSFDVSVGPEPTSLEIDLTD